MENDPIFNSILGLDPENGFRRTLSCDPVNATFSSISYINDSYLFPQMEDDEDKLDYCRPYKYIRNVKGDPCSIADFDQTQFDDFNTLEGKILYDDFSMDNTLVTDLNLVCNKQFQVALVGSIYMVGLKNFIKPQCFFI